MKYFDTDMKLLLGKFYSSAERETLDYVVNGAREILGDSAPDRKAVKEFLTIPDADGQLSARQQVVVIDQLLECMEVNIRTIFDLIRYKEMKDAGIVRDLDEFLALFRSDRKEGDG